jgi:hypothetical protein
MNLRDINLIWFLLCLRLKFFIDNFLFIVHLKLVFILKINFFTVIIIFIIRLLMYSFLIQNIINNILFNVLLTIF